MRLNYGFGIGYEENRFEKMNNSDWLVSVIVPVYNVRQFIREALDSIIKQSYKKLEIIVINDGSTDGSDKICDEYKEKDKRILVRHQNNKGLSATRNVGLSMMTGDVVAFLDSDDAYLPNFIEAMVDALKRENADIALCKYSVVRTNERMVYDKSNKAYPLIESGVYDRKQALTSYVNGFVSPNIWNRLYRRDLWEGIRFPEGRVYEDVETTYYLFEKCNRLCVLDTSLYLHRLHPGTITMDCSGKYIEDCIKASTTLMEVINKNIPEYFTYEQLKDRRTALFLTLISFYCKYSLQNNNRSYRNQLRGEILCLCDEGLNYNSPKVFLCHLLIKHLPMLLRFSYSILFWSRCVYRTGKKCDLNSYT